MRPSTASVTLTAAQPTVDQAVAGATGSLTLVGRQTVVSARVWGHFSADSLLMFEQSTDGALTWTPLDTAVLGAPPAGSHGGGAPMVLMGTAAALAIVRVRCLVLAQGDNIRVELNGVAAGSDAADPAPGADPALATPDLLASLEEFTNPFIGGCFVYISGGNVQGITLGGSDTGLTGGSFFVPFAQTITLTYSQAPTWVWFAR